MSSAVYFPFFLPLGSIVPLFYINHLCPLILLPFYQASLPAFVMSFVCVLLYPPSSPFLYLRLSLVCLGLPSSGNISCLIHFWKGLGSPNNTHYGNETVTRCHRCIISNYFHTFNYSTKNSWFFWWDLQITACLLIPCSGNQIAEVCLMFWGIEVWLMSSSL